MSFIMQCPCGQQMTVEDQHVGMQVMCVRCRRPLRVPTRPLDPASPAQAETLDAAPPVPPGGVPAPVSSADFQAGHSYLKPHRGVLILVLGILSVTGCCCCGGLWAGIPALVLALGDLNEMRDGKRDPSGRGMTQAGLVLGALGIALVVLAALGRGAGYQPWPHAPSPFNFPYRT